MPLFLKIIETSLSNFNLKKMNILRMKQQRKNLFMKMMPRMNYRQEQEALQLNGKQERIL